MGQIPAQHWHKIQSIALSSTYDEKTASLFKDVKRAEPVVEEPVVEEPVVTDSPPQEHEPSVQQVQSGEEEEQVKEAAEVCDHPEQIEKKEKVPPQSAQTVEETPIDTTQETS